MPRFELPNAEFMRPGKTMCYRTFTTYAYDETGFRYGTVL